MAAPAILVFDGDCGFCTRSARWVERRWPAGAAAALPSQRFTDGQLQDLGLTRSDVAEQVWWVETGVLLGGARAVARALRTTRGGWRRFGRAMELPPLAWLGPPVYRFVARNRHLLPGSTEACKV